MPIRVIDPKTSILIGPNICTKNSPQETAAIMNHGFGNGCSLTVESDALPLTGVV